ncbi:24843_t:CDS:1, partial [Gigaspora margarita]
ITKNQLQKRQCEKVLNYLPPPQRQYQAMTRRRNTKTPPPS